jgi:hypothetical protein
MDDVYDATEIDNTKMVMINDLMKKGNTIKVEENNF